MTKVVHCRKEKYDIYIGRPSIFGNPLSIGKDGTRAEVIKKYKDYFYDNLENHEVFKIAVERLRGKVLGCWCKPQACHGDVIIEYLNKEKQ